MYFLDGKEIANSTNNGMRWLDFTLGIGQSSITKEDLERVKVRKMIVEVEEVQQKVKDFNVLIPVCDFGWEGTDIDDLSVHAEMLAKEMALDLRLVGIPQSVDAATRDGTRATCALSHNGHSYSNSQSLFFIREDLLKSFLRKNRLSLIWVVWGERETSAHLALRRRHEAERFGSGIFQEVTQYR